MHSVSVATFISLPMSSYVDILCLRVNALVGTCLIPRGNPPKWFYVSHIVYIVSHAILNRLYILKNLIETPEIAFKFRNILYFYSIVFLSKNHGVSIHLFMYIYMVSICSYNFSLWHHFLAFYRFCGHYELYLFSFNFDF